MLDSSLALSGICNNLGQTLSDTGFALYYPPEVKKNEFPAVKENDRVWVTMDGADCSLKIEYCNNTVGLFYAETVTEQVADGDYTRLALSLLNVDEGDDRDIKYIAEDFSETLYSKFADGKKPKTNKKNTPVAVSKTAVKNGAFYDVGSFGARFVTVYPELKACYKQNLDEYGEFLPEDFFKKYGTPAVMATIRENNPQKMKKLFNLLNEIYDNGVNDVQSLIIVTVLGTLHEDETMLANCIDYMNDDLCVNVIKVNKYLGAPGSKGARMRLENPPRYKPKKKQRGLMSTLLSGGGAGQ